MADSAIRRYESGHGNPTMKTLQRISDALQVPVSEFIEPARMSTKESRRRQEERMGLEPGYLDRGESCFNRVLFAYAGLNDAGRIEAAKRIEELAQLPQYKRGDPDALDTEKDE